ncbi:putative nucleotidyltransferase substrate binding domain-containing protein [Rhodocista pekingensis]|uniref:Nucleotidyltransferase substrate binding domain-containing protein n=1 Tax=Rhodocista pekingensis TaxID=201185 RepID=A0ABW2KU04_9PROT
MTRRQDGRQGPGGGDAGLPSPQALLETHAPDLLRRVADAASLDDLAAALGADGTGSDGTGSEGGGHDRLVRTLVAAGAPVTAVSRAVALLNDRVMERLYRLVLTPAQARSCCLIVMGSEGRGEQLLKTDQDNGLILPDGADWPDLPGRLAAFSAGLARLGWPPCPGRVMVTNPAWVMPERQWQDAVRHWVRSPGEDGVMAVAIFADAAAVAGDAALLARTRAVLLELIRGHAPFLWQFARIVLQFDTPLGWFGHLVTEGGEHRGQLDLKKGGLFPIVHGVRSLALEARLERATNTLDRIDLLVEAGKLDEVTAAELRRAFDFLVGLRLRTRLEGGAQGEGRGGGGAVPDTLVTPARLSAADRDGLRDALRSVRQFKDLLSYHFHLSVL